MGTQEIKEKIHKLIDDSSEDKLEHVYSILQATEYSNEFKAVLDKEFDDYQQNGEGGTREELDVLIKDRLNRK